jgi:hypothetical protein
MTEVDFDDGNGAARFACWRPWRHDRRRRWIARAEAVGVAVTPDGETTVSGHGASLFRPSGDPRRIAAWTCGRSKTSYAAGAVGEDDATAATATLGAIACH